ncbi:MAG: V-type ATP synthase subunit I [archaeon]|uniref:A-type ATP synthase subunit I n=1 Tax=Methanobrevibacter gottschalkii DSM 11977 TaxID=1122229 RepID=A0A3N5C2R7_9EURY|nr:MULTISPECIES: V-type ATP synthase subunit I [Methanobrevibacter]MCQ2971304.1 V-type ATP synthase subunit I [archaeon]OED00534.1 V-type ATP synthase subunit I [Methanobrevibacter sp. A27]RPF50461.1 V/A-type H+-transporting ATPase subunit I [Methanobrevibacter gottschalkii DSM 11977]
MFKTARMRKIRIVTLDKYVAPTVDALHESGLIQVSDISESIQQDPELAELVTPSKATPYTGKLSSLLMKTNGISELLGNSISEGHGLKDTLMSFISPDMPVQKEVEKLDTPAFIEKAEETLAKVESKTSVIEGKLAALDSETSELKSNKSLAKRLSHFDMDLALLKDSKYTSTTVGRINAESTSEIKNELSNLTDELEIFTVPMDDDDGEVIAVVTLKEFSDDVYSTLRKFDFEKIEVANVEGTPQHIISSADSRLLTIESERAAVKKELRAVAEQWDDEILALKEQLENEKDKNEILSSFVQTKDAYVLEAWVPVKDTEEVEQLVEKSSEGHCAFETIEIEGTDDEDVPILQQNGWYAKPFEFLVDMYSPVRYNEIDPTIFVAITFPFFFGFCLTDAIYGLVVSAIGVVIIRGLGKVKESMRSFGWILVWAGLWAVILGLLTNGFIGDFPERIAGFRLPTVFAPVEAFKHPDTILLIAIGVGLLYTNVGFLLGAIDNLRYGNVKEAIGSQLCWFVFEAGIILLALGYMMPAIGMVGMALGGILIIATIGMLVWANGAYGVMDIFGYMGDVLSYARLLALCLATGGIAMTVNILAQMLNNMVPHVGIVLAIFVFIFGHIANFAFQVLGAFINSLRLNYVEFFSQFFMSGKGKFEAFKANRTFTKLK